MAASARLFLLCAVAFTPAVALAQAYDSDYTAAYPPVQTIESQIKGTDPTDTLARQVAVFRRLQNDISNTKYARTIKGPFTPGEQKTMQAYRAAEAELIQAYTTSHTPDEVAAFKKLCGRYVFNQDLYNDYHRLMGQQGLNASRDADTKTHEDAQRARGRGGPRPNSASSTSSGAAPGADFLNSMFENDPEIRRCLELGGGTPDDCAHAGVKGMGNSAEVAVRTMLGDDPHGAAVRSGVILVGSYRGRTDASELALTPDGKAELRKCGTLANETRAYALRRSGTATELVIANQPQPIVVALRPDGTLVGPGDVTVKGQVLTGYRQTYYGCPAGTAAANCRPTNQAVYAASIQRCTLGQLAPQTAPAPAQQPSGLAAAVSHFLETGSHEPVTYGLRLTGAYGSSTGLKLAFSNRAVTLDCGRAHVNAPYSVENTPAGFVVRVQNPAGPLSLIVAPDNSLRGSGSTTINGRLISSFHGDDVRYTPHSEICAVGTFAPVQN